MIGSHRCGQTDDSNDELPRRYRFVPAVPGVAGIEFPATLLWLSRTWWRLTD